MFPLSVTKKTGFISGPVELIEIFDSTGRIFYRSRAGKNGLAFNLPKGNYLIPENVKIRPLSSPINFPMPKLPKREKPFELPKIPPVVEIVENPNKASIHIGKSKIWIDPEIAKKGIPQLAFILFHELGHYLYFSEEKCDTFAMRQMIKQGFNPSQCGVAVYDTLGDYERSKKRKICILQNVKKIQSAK